MIDIKPPNTVKSILVTLFLFILFPIVVSCHIQKTIVEEETTFEKNPKLLFLNYKVSAEEDGKKSMVLINTIVTDGSLKKRASDYLKTPTIGDLKCTQLDEKSNELQNLFIENPLIKVIEFVNDSLSFEKKNVILKNNELSLRLQLNSKTKSILISEVIDSLQQTKALIKTELK